MCGIDEVVSKIVGCREGLVCRNRQVGLGCDLGGQRVDRQLRLLVLVVLELQKVQLFIIGLLVRELLHFLLLSKQVQVQIWFMQAVVVAVVGMLLVLLVVLVAVAVLQQIHMAQLELMVLEAVVEEEVRLPLQLPKEVEMAVMEQ